MAAAASAAREIRAPYWRESEMPKKPSPRQQPDGSPSRRVVEIPDRSCQASKAELEEPIRVSGTFHDAVKALVQPVNVCRVPVAKKRGS